MDTMATLPLTTVTFIIMTFACQVQGHGYLINPAQRSSRWRVSSNSIYVTNYDDNALRCGGFDIQYGQNGGECGPCGDNAADSRPRAHEAGGLYAPVSRTVAETYVMGSSIYVNVQLTSAHEGYFEFRLCEHNDFATVIEQSCLDEHVLLLTGTQTTRYPTSGSLSAGLHTIQLDLPPNVQCSLCVLQWLYNTGNSWGTFANGTSCVGCGDQENFKNCADIAIIGPSTPSSDSSSSSTSTLTTTSTATSTTSTATTTTSITTPLPSTASTSTSATTPVPPTTSTPTSTTTTLPPTISTSKSPSTTTITTTTTTSSSLRSGEVCLLPANRASITSCDVTSDYAGVTGMGLWCKENCITGNCPSSHCQTCYC